MLLIDEDPPQFPVNKQHTPNPLAQEPDDKPPEDVTSGQIIIPDNESVEESYSNVNKQLNE